MTSIETIAIPAALITLILIVAIWELIWKGIALWHAARRKQKGWFILILIFNTVGILPIVYLIIYRKKKSIKK